MCLTALCGSWKPIQAVSDVTPVSPYHWRLQVVDRRHQRDADVVWWHAARKYFYRYVAREMRLCCARTLAWHCSAASAAVSWPDPTAGRAASSRCRWESRTWRLWEPGEPEDGVRREGGWRKTWQETEMADRQHIGWTRTKRWAEHTETVITRKGGEKWNKMERIRKQPKCRTRCTTAKPIINLRNYHKN